MSVCVRIAQPGENIGAVSGQGAAFLSVPTPVIDESCSSGLIIQTAQEVNNPANADRVQDMTDLFYAFLLVLVTVWGAKQILNLFTGDTDRG